MLKVDAQVSRVLASVARDRAFMEWLAEQRTSIALSMATMQGTPLHWGQGQVQMLDELLKTLQGAHKSL